MSFIKIFIELEIHVYVSYLLELFIYLKKLISKYLKSDKYILNLIKIKDIDEIIYFKILFYLSRVYYF